MHNLTKAKRKIKSTDGSDVLDDSIFPMEIQPRDCTIETSDENNEKLHQIFLVKISNLIQESDFLERKICPHRDKANRFT